jgi:hypothetical protein
MRPCPCGSGEKFKRCCGAPAASTAEPPKAAREIISHQLLEMRRLEAKDHRRRLMQGFGQPIISGELQGYRRVAVGNHIQWSKTWLTFNDFLFAYIKAVLTPLWGQAEQSKPESEQHPLMHWLRRIAVVMRSAHADQTPAKINTTPITGAFRAYLGLAYDLYLSAHNAELAALLVKRLRNEKTFEGALYEAYVVGRFAVAGFSVEFEDESDSTVSHCEFTATRQVTGRKFSVEAKAISSASSRAGESNKSPRVRRLLSNALRKEAAYDRIIFIELNRTQDLSPHGEPDWGGPLV